TRLAFQRPADGFEGGEADRARLAGFQDRQVGERNADLLGQLRQRHTALVEHVVQRDEDGHGQTVPSSSSRIWAPCSKTRARTKSSSTATQRVGENFQL